MVAEPWYFPDVFCLLLIIVFLKNIYLGESNTLKIGIHLVFDKLTFKYASLSLKHFKLKKHSKTQVLNLFKKSKFGATAGSSEHGEKFSSRYSFKDCIYLFTEKNLTIEEL